MTALLVCSGMRKSDKPINFVLMPNLREKITYKNTSASSIREIKDLIDQVMQEA